MRSLLLSMTFICLLVVAATASAHPPAASFTVAPESPAAGEPVAFHSTSTPEPQHTEPLTLDWDLDNDGAFDDASGADAARAYPPGDYIVRLRARHGGPGGTAAHESVAQRRFRVPAPPQDTDPPPPGAANQPPVAAFDRDCGKVGGHWLCTGMLARESKPHTLDASPSHDPDGTIVRYQWDLDGHGDFEVDTGSTPTVTHTFERLQGLVDLRKRRVRVRVTDDRGATAETEMTLTLLEPSCEPLAAKGRLRVTGVCLRRRKVEVDGHKVLRFYSEKPVKLGGIGIAPAAGRKVTIDLPDEPGAPAPRIAGGGAVVTVNAPGGEVRLVDGAFGWRLQDGVHLSGLQVSSKARLNGLRVTAVSPPELSADGTSSKLGLRLALPSQFGGATSDELVTLTPGKAIASAGAPLRFEVADAAIGPVGLDHLVVTFDGDDLWEISAGVKLPPPIPYTIEGEAGIRGGDFEYAGASIDFGTPGIGPLGPVFLQRIEFRIEISPKKSECVPKVGKEYVDQRKLIKEVTGMDWDVPNFIIDHGIPTFALCGEVGLTGGPTVLGAAAIRLDAGLGLATYDDRPAVFRAFGEVSLVEIPLADAELELHTNGYTRMRAGFEWGIEDLATLEGFLMFEMMAPRFNALAHVDACLEIIDWCSGARALVSSKGVAVCLKIDVFFDDWEPGFGYKWGETFPTLYFAGCDIGPYKEHVKSGIDEHITAVPARAGERSIELPDGLPGATIVARGDGAPPQITLIGPKGERITTPEGLQPLVQEPFFVLKDPRANLTQFAIAKPSGGRWRVVVEPGSAPVVSLASANGLERPQVRAKVTGRGHRRTLTYRVTQVPGQRVTFLERGPTAGRRIGEARGARGRIAFRPAPGAAERRRIVALVTQDGRTRGEYEVGRYAAPGPQRPSRPKALRVTRRKRTLRVAWKAARPADVQQVTVRLGNGQRLIRRTRAARLVVRGVPRGVRATVHVRGVLEAGVLGRAATARSG